MNGRVRTTEVTEEARQVLPGGGHKRRRRAKAERELQAILSSERKLGRRITAAAIVMRLSPVLLPILLRFTLDPIRDQRAVEWFGTAWTPQQLLIGTLVIGVVIGVIRGVATGVFIAKAGQYGHAIVARLRIAMYEHILRLPARYLDRRGTGRVMLRFIGDSDALRNWISRTRPAVVGDFVLLVALVGALAFVSWPLATATAVVLPLIGSAIWLLRPQLYQRTLDARRLQARFTGHIESHLRNIRQAKWLDRHQAWRDHTRRIASEIADRNAHRDRRAALVRGTGQLLTYGLLPVLLAVAVAMLWQNALSLGKFIALTWIAMHMAVAFQRLTQTLVIREKAMVSIDRILRLLERSAEGGRGSSGRKLKSGPPTIEACELVFSESGIGSKRCPWTAEIQGPGWTTLPKAVVAADLFDVLLRFKKPDSGSLRINGQELQQLSVRSLRRAIGWIGSEPVVYEGTIEDNLRMGDPKLDRDRLMARVSEFQLGVPDIDAWLGKETGANGRELSRDDSYRVALLRAVLNRPRLVLVESVGDISAGLSELIRYQLEQLAAHRTLVITSQLVAEQLLTSVPLAG